LAQEIEDKAKTTTNGKAKEPIREDKVNEAMWTVDEILERCTLPYVVLGQAAYDIKHGKTPSGERIVFGILKQHAVPSQTSLLPVLLKDVNIYDVEILTDGWRIFTNGVTILIRIIPKKFPTLLDPDTVVYNNWWWRLPNPFNAYWEGWDHYDK